MSIATSIGGNHMLSFALCFWHLFCYSLPIPTSPPWTRYTIMSTRLPFWLRIMQKISTILACFCWYLQISEAQQLLPDIIELHGTPPFPPRLNKIFLNKPNIYDITPAQIFLGVLFHNYPNLAYNSTFWTILRFLSTQLQRTQILHFTSCSTLGWTITLY